jgi:hypothetical protein
MDSENKDWAELPANIVLVWMLDVVYVMNGLTPSEVTQIWVKTDVLGYDNMSDSNIDYANLQDKSIWCFRSDLRMVQAILWKGMYSW